MKASLLGILASIVLTLPQGLWAQTASTLVPGVEGDPYFGTIEVGSSTTFGANEGLQVQFACPSGFTCAPSTINSVIIEGSSDFKIVQEDCTGLFSPTGEAFSRICTIQVRFSPTSVGEKSGDVKISYFSIFPQVLYIPLSGTAVAPTKIPKVTSTNSTCLKGNSSINLDSLTLQENIPLVGVPFFMSYSSERLRPESISTFRAIGVGGWMPSIYHYYDFHKALLYNGDGSIRNIQAGLFGTGYYLTDPTGSEIYYFDKNGTHLKTVDALTGVTKFTFGHTSFRVTSIIDQFGNQTTLQYSGSTILLRSPYGQVSTLALESHGYLASLTNPNSERYNMTYDSGGNLLTFQKPMGQTGVHTYDTAGRIIKDQSAAGDFTNFVRQFDASTATQTVIATSALNRSTTVQTKAADQNSSHRLTTPDGGVSVSSDQDNGVKSNTDKYGNIALATKAQDPRFGWMAPFDQNRSYAVPQSNINLSSTTTKTADLASRDDFFSFSTLTSRTILQNDPTRLFASTYQSGNRLLTTTSPLNRVTYQTLNANGQPTAIQVAALLPVNVSYDNHGRITMVNQGSHQSVLTYDQFSNIATSTDALDRTTSFEYDGANRPLRQILPDNNVIAMTWDKNGNMTSITPPGKTAHTFAYNLFGLLQNYLPPTVGSSLSGATIYDYNLDKQLTQITRPDGAIVAFNYGVNSGLLTTISSPSGNYSMTYLPNSDLVNTLTSPDHEVMTFQYSGSIPKSIATSGPVTSSLQYSFNTDGTISQIAVAGGNNQLNNVVLAYDKDGLLISAGNEILTRNNYGAVSATSHGKIAEAMSFDNLGQITSDMFVFNSKQTIAQAYYIRDNLGRISSISRKLNGTNHDRVFTYDHQGRLISAKQGHFPEHQYTYDQNGNRTSAKTFGRTINAAYDAQDRLVNYGSTEFQFSANGDLEKKIEHRFDFDDRLSWLKRLGRDEPKTTQYFFDVFGNLKTVILPNGKKIEYIVDGQNRLVCKKVNGKLVQGFVYQSQTQVAAELDGNGKLIKQFVYGSKENIPDLMIYQGKEYRIISDQVGTPKLVIESETGKVLEDLIMDEFGNNEFQFGSSVLPFGFAGGIFDRDTGLVKFGAREYSPEVGRWVSKDPIGFSAGDTNLFGYVANDPINFVDPSGLARGDWWDPRTYILPVVEGGQGTTDFVRNYNNMRSANTIGADKYFHCMANCQSTQRGPGGLTAAEMIGEGRELTDQYIKGDSRQECDKDRAANAQGRNGANSGTCSQVCGSLRPNGLGPQW